MDNKAISSDLIRGHIDTIILYSLLDGKKTSQQIIDSVSLKSENKYQLNQATLYSSLKRLESLKLISSVWHDAVDGRRKFFELTASGKDTAYANLSNWEYSRAIIDKLIGFNGDNSSDLKTRVVEIEKIVEKPVYIEKIIEKNSNGENSEKPIKTDELLNKTFENTQNGQSLTELNFRNILNGLIKTTEKQKQEKTENEEISARENIQVKDFNETINDTVKDSFINTTNKIDFTDLKEKVESDGYKLSVSSKYNAVKTGSLLINKLNLFSALSITLLCLLEFLIFAVSTNAFIKYTAFAVILSIIIIAVLPTIFGVIYYKNKNKTSCQLKKDGILYSAIIAFNLILFIIVLALLFNMNFTDKRQLSLFLILPTIIIADVVIFYTLRFYVSKLKIFTIDKK